eukprot:1021655-Prymnesium_polylepis.1
MTPSGFPAPANPTPISCCTPLCVYRNVGLVGSPPGEGAGEAVMSSLSGRHSMYGVHGWHNEQGFPS